MNEMNNEPRKVSRLVWLLVGFSNSLLGKVFFVVPNWLLELRLEALAAPAIWTVRLIVSNEVRGFWGRCGLLVVSISLLQLLDTDEMPARTLLPLLVAPAPAPAVVAELAPTRRLTELNNLALLLSNKSQVFVLLWLLTLVFSSAEVGAAAHTFGGGCGASSEIVFCYSINNDSICY